MKIKDMPSDKPLGGTVFKHPETGESCIWHSQWQKGVWYKKDRSSNQVMPLYVETLEDALEFEVVSNPTP